MKTEIDRQGIMTVKSETELEAYALSKWCEENISKPKLGDSTDKENLCKNLLFVWNFE